MNNPSRHKPIFLFILIIIILGIIWYIQKSPYQTKPIDIYGTETQSVVDTPTPESVVLPPYISAQEGWPIVIHTSAQSYVCIESTTSLPTATQERIINNKPYCISDMADGAAGSIYHTYTYTTTHVGGTQTTTFTLRYPQCYNYDEPAQSECKKMQFEFNTNLDGIVASVMH